MIRVTMRLRGGLACFGLLVEPDEEGLWHVVQAAPIAAWTLGRPARIVWDHYARHGRVEWRH